MAMNTSGGEGGPTTHTVTASSLEVKTVFTTPNTADYQFTVEVTIYGGENLVSWSWQGDPSGLIPVVHRPDPVNGPMTTFRGTFGPNVAVKIPMRNHAGANKDVYTVYSYLGQKIT